MKNLLPTTKMITGYTENSLQKKEEEKLPRIIKQENKPLIKPVLNIPKEVSEKIAYLNSIMGDIEWSGVLFYSMDGTLDKDLVIDIKDVLVLDIGSSVYTNYAITPEVAGYMCENGLTQCILGHIHSHHTMSAFFSGTDMNTLIKEALDNVFFLSLIVNNAGTYVAAITNRSEVVSTTQTTTIQHKINYEGKVESAPVIKDTTEVFQVVNYTFCDIYIHNELLLNLLIQTNVIKKAKEEAELDFKQQFDKTNIQLPRVNPFGKNDSWAAAFNTTIPTGKKLKKTTKKIKNGVNKKESIEEFFLENIFGGIFRFGKALSDEMLILTKKSLGVMVDSNYEYPLYEFKDNMIFMKRKGARSDVKALNTCPEILDNKILNDYFTSVSKVKEMEFHFKQHLIIFDSEKNVITENILSNFTVKEVFILYVMYCYAALSDQYYVSGVDKDLLVHFQKYFQL